MHAEDQYGIRALKAGAAGYLTKESAPEQLIAALRKVSQGGKYITPSLAEQIVYSFESDANNPPHENLSDREYEVMCLIASGKTVKEIGEQLFLSVKTVSTYRARVLEKMHLKNNSELTNYAIKNRLVN
jgi:DNA-binding NarL/FixJ family response regulator